MRIVRVRDRIVMMEGWGKVDEEFGFWDWVFG